MAEDVERKHEIAGRCGDADESASRSLSELVPAAVLQLGSLEVALPTTEVEAVVTVEDLVKVPLSPQSLAGVAVFGGEPAPVLDLSVLLGVKPPRSGGFVAAVLCRVGDGVVALMGGRIRRVGRMRQGPLDMKWRFARFGVEWRGRVVPLLDPELLLAAVRSGGALEPAKDRAHHGR